MESVNLVLYPKFCFKVQKKKDLDSEPNSIDHKIRNRKKVLMIVFTTYQFILNGLSYQEQLRLI